MTKILNGYSVYGDYDQQIMVLTLEMKQPVQEEKMELAFREALKRAPLINVRLTWKDNCLYFEDNKSEFCLSGKTGLKLGDENQGFLFAASVDEKKMTIASLHALADGVSFFPFIKLVLMSYLQLIGEGDFEKQIERISSKLTSDTGEKKLVERLSETGTKIQPTVKHFQFCNFEESRKREYKSVVFGLEKDKMLASHVSQLAEVIGKQIKKINIDGLPITCNVAYDLRSRLNLSEPLHECYSVISVPYEEGKFEETWRMIESQGKMVSGMSLELPIWLKLASEDMSPEMKKRFCNRVLKSQYQYVDTFVISCIALTNKLDKLNEYVDYISVSTESKRQNLVFEMNQLGDTMCVSITYVDVAEKIVEGVIEEFKKMNILRFIKEVNLPEVCFELPRF